MSQPILTKTSLRDGIYTATLSGVPGDAPDIAVMFRDEPLPEVKVTADAPGTWTVCAPIPTTALSDGTHVFLVIDNASGTRLGDFAVIAGDGADDALRTEVELLRAELDLLKRAFRRHCVETSAR
ncbi:MAG: hypothetical protein VXW58_18450 [Pseudomonadota bacterium]|nr:hypothetical protein [Pseudomonadota bacterium]